MIKKLEKWTLDSALEYIRKYQDEFKKFNFHIGLAGSVLNYGSSLNDLDIIVMGFHNGQGVDLNSLLEWMARKLDAQPMTDKQYDDDTRIMYRTYTPNKIDFFIYQ